MSKQVRIERSLSGPISLWYNVHRNSWLATAFVQRGQPYNTQLYSGRGPTTDGALLALCAQVAQGEEGWTWQYKKEMS